MVDVDRHSWPMRSFIIEVGDETCSVDSSFVPGERAEHNTAVTTAVLREAGVEVVELKIFRAVVGFDSDGGNIIFSEIAPEDGFMAKSTDKPYWMKDE